LLGTQLTIKRIRRHGTTGSAQNRGLPISTSNDVPPGIGRGVRTVREMLLLHEAQSGGDGDNPIQQERQPCSRIGSSNAALAFTGMLTKRMAPILTIAASNKEKCCCLINSKFHKLTENVSASLRKSAGQYKKNKNTIAVVFS
jgi:hypothetical protein